MTRHPLILLAGLAAVAAFAGCSQQPTSPRTATVLSGLPAGGNGGPIDTTGGPPPPPPPTAKKIDLQCYFTDSASVAGAEVHLHIVAHSFAEDTTGVVYTITSPEGWSDFPISGTLVVPGMASAERTFSVHVPVDAAPGEHYVEGEFAGGGNWYLRMYVLVGGSASP